MNRTNVEGVCIHVGQCEYIKEIQRQGRLKQNLPTICDRVERTVCCPENANSKQEIRTLRPTATAKRISEKSEWSIHATELFELVSGIDVQ